MDKEETEEKVKQIIVDLFGHNPDDVHMESNFKDDLHVDSLDEVELLMEFEEKFDIEISDEDAEKFKAVEQAVDYIFNALSQG